MFPQRRLSYKSVPTSQRDGCGAYFTEQLISSQMVNPIRRVRW